MYRQGFVVLARLARGIVNFGFRGFYEIRAQHVQLASCSRRACLKQGGLF